MTVTAEDNASRMNANERKHPATKLQISEEIKIGCTINNKQSLGFWDGSEQ